MNTKTQKLCGLNDCGLNFQYDNRFIVNQCLLLTILAFYLNRYAIFVESMPTDLKPFSVLQKCVSVCVFRAWSVCFPMHICTIHSALTLKFNYMFKQQAIVECLSVSLTGS